VVVFYSYFLSLPLYLPFIKLPCKEGLYWKISWLDHTFDCNIFINHWIAEYRQTVHFGYLYFDRSFLLFHRFVVKGEYMGRFYLMYSVTLIPFFIVNGLLTGSFIS